MSILIKGMDMPTSCADCRFCGDYCFAKGDENKHSQLTCPIIELPPHGRLIDERWLKDAMATTLEALIKNPKMDAQEMHIIAAFDTLREMIDDSPTIIEAEASHKCYHADGDCIHDNCDTCPKLCEVDDG